MLTAYNSSDLSNQKVPPSLPNWADTRDRAHTKPLIDSLDQSWETSTLKMVESRQATGKQVVRTMPGHGGTSGHACVVVDPREDIIHEYNALIYFHSNVIRSPLNEIVPVLYVI